MDRVFAPLPPVPDHPRLEEEILQWWEDEHVFDRLRERNRGNPKWSFVDGPVTANKEMGFHTAWGRTLKDVFQRYKAARGFDQRYQYGWDCHALSTEAGDEARQRRGRGRPRRAVRPQGEWRVGRRRAPSRRDVRGGAARRAAGRLALSGPIRPPAGRRRDRAPGRGVGRGLARRRNRH